MRKNERNSVKVMVRERERELVIESRRVREGDGERRRESLCESGRSNMKVRERVCVLMRERD